MNRQWKHFSQSSRFGFWKRVGKGASQMKRGHCGKTGRVTSSVFFGLVQVEVRIPKGCVSLSERNSKCVCLTHLRIKNIQSDRENHESLKLNGTHQFLVYADDDVCVCVVEAHIPQRNA